MKSLDQSDLNHILKRTPHVWDSLRNGHLFITGGTGFFGRWLLESLVQANQQLNLGLEATILTRDPALFAAKASHLARQSFLHFVAGDVRSFDFPAPVFSHFIHAATDASANLNTTQPLLMLDTIIEGSRRTLELARLCQTKSFLLVSSGAVYGRQPPELNHLTEDYSGGPSPTDPGSAYAQAKRIAEFLGVTYARQYGLPVKIARCFAFVGPALPLDIHFAVGNFIRDAMRGGPLEIKGDGTPYRSYMYAADLTVWLWTILEQGEVGRPYNVGSDQAISIADLAYTVAALFAPAPSVSIARMPTPGQLPERYVPSVERAIELGLKTQIDLQDALKRTIEWYAPGLV